MNIRGREFNIWKGLVLAWGAHKAFKLARAFVRAKQLAKKNVRFELVEKYSDL